MAVKVVVLTTGQEIIGQVAAKMPSGVMVGLTKAFWLAPTSEHGASLIPYLPAIKEGTILLNRDLIVAEGDPVPQLLSMYQQATGSIVSAPAGLILPT